MTDAVTAEAPSEIEAAAPQTEARAMPEIEHPVGRLRQVVLDALLDSVERGPLSVAELHAHMPAGTLKSSAESAIRRELVARRILRTSPGHYIIAPPAPEPPAPKPAPSPEPPKVREDGHTDAEWLSALEAYFENPASWNVEKLGPQPDSPDNWISPTAKMRMNDRLRKREERRRERAAADASLRDKLIAGCFGNVMTGAAGLSDLAPVKAMLRDGVPVEHILIGLKRVTDRRIDPRAAPIASERSGQPWTHATPLSRGT